MALSDSTVLFSLLSLVAYLLVVKTWYPKFARSSLDDLPGPKSESWLHGNIGTLLLSGEVPSKWPAEYGGVVKVKGAFGQNHLLVSDAKALQYVSHTGGYRFRRDREHTALMRAMVGDSLTVVDSDSHKRHRKIMLPGFQAPEIRSFLPMMLRLGESMVSKWNDKIHASNDKDGSTVVDLYDWVTKLTLDVAGEAAFDYNFGALEDSGNDLIELITDLPLKIYGNPKPYELLVLSLVQFLPESWLIKFIGSDWSSRLKEVHQMTKKTTEMMRGIVRAKGNSDGPRRDIISLIMKANQTEDKKLQLSEDEMLDQLRLLTVAGHESTALSIMWGTWELVKNRALQDKLRAEIREQERKKRSRGEEHWLAKDFDEMPYLGAVVKETLRVHPIAPILFRQATQDEVLPLSHPITCPSGEVITQLPVPNGTKIFMNVTGYNQSRDIFKGDIDVMKFDPERWLGQREKGVTIGPFENVLAFGAGNRGCIAWRLGVLEMHSLIVELISNFEFEPGPYKIKEEMADIMTPVLEGQVEEGSQLPVRVRPARRD